MRKPVLCVLGGVVLWAAAAALAGEAAPAPAPARAPDAEALKKQTADLKEKAKGIQAKLDEAYARIKATPDLAKLAEAEAKATKAYHEARQADKDYAAATQAAREAQAAFEKLIDQQLAASDQAKPLAAELAGAAKKRAVLSYDEALARLELTHESSPLNFALDRDPEIVKMRTAIAEAPDKDARARAFKAYEEARKAKRDAMPEAQKALARIETDKKERDALRTAESAARATLADLRHTIARSDAPDLKAARDRMAATLQAVADASHGEALNAVRGARDQALAACDAKRKELTDADPNIAALKKERDALRDQIADLDRKIRAAAK